MSSPLSFWKNKKNFIIVAGSSSILFLALLYHIYQNEQTKRSVVSLPKYSPARFYSINDKIKERQSVLFDNRQELAAETDKNLQNQRAELQKKIFQEQVAAKTQKIITSALTPSAPAPTVSPAAEPAPAPMPKPKTAPKPRTTVS